jgi:hypothetical protein
MNNEKKEEEEEEEKKEEEEEKKEKKEEEEEEEEKKVEETQCDNCNEQIIYSKNGYYILSKQEDEFCWCQCCFDNNWKTMRDDGWECDDFELEDESEKDE